jgi:hypothetical protein
MGKSSDPPPAPNYASQAYAQGQANIKSAQVGAELNRVDTTTPYGSLTYSQPNPKDPNQWAANVALSPDQQALLDAQSKGQITKATDANNMLGTVGDATAQPFSTAGIPGQVNSISTPDLSLYNGSTQAPVSALDTSGVPKLNTDWGSQVQQAQDAAYKQQTSMLDPQYAQAEESLRSRLAASGATEGSEAFSNAMKNFNNQKATDYTGARNSAIGIGNNEQATLAGESLAGNNQLYAQALQGANFENTAAGQSFNQGLGEAGYNSGIKQDEFGNNTAAANFQNNSRATGLAQEEALRSIPLNEYNALMTGNQVTNPNFNVGTSQVNAPGAAPVFAAAQAQNQNALDIYNQQQATDNSNTQAGVGLASTAAMAAIMF